MTDLKDNTVLITGSSRGVGRACALRFAEAGANVVINYVVSRSAAEEVAEAVQALGCRAAVVRADVSYQDDIVAMLDFVRSEFGRLDVLVSNAASGGFRPLMTANAANFEAAMNLNVRACLFLVQAALPLMERPERRAKVVVLSSHGSYRALPMYGLIGSSKAALESLVRHLALELGGRGINLNIVLAGLLDTDSSRAIPGFNDLNRRWSERTLVGDRKLLPEDVADVVHFLATRNADLVQGQTLIVDGGASILA